MGRLESLELSRMCIDRLRPAAAATKSISGSHGAAGGRRRLSTCSAVVVPRFGGPEVMEYRDGVDLPDLCPNEVLVRTRAAAVNPLDIRMRGGYGKSLFASLLPLVLGRDVSGEIAAVGSAVRRLHLGQEVFGALHPTAVRGTYSEYTILAEEQLVPKPTSLSHAEAAAIPFAALTAWRALRSTARIKNGQQVLILGGGGAVGLSAIQLAKAVGCQVTVTCAKSSIERTMEAGAGRAVDYASENIRDELKGRFDVVLDTIGMPETEALGINLLRRGGNYLTLQGELVSLADKYGLVAGAAAAASKLVQKQLQYRQSHGIEYWWSVMRADEEGLEEVCRLAKEGQFKVDVGRIFPLSEAANAHRIGEGKQVKGKVAKFPSASKNLRISFVGKLNAESTGVACQLCVRERRVQPIDYHVSQFLTLRRRSGSIILSLRERMELRSGKTLNGSLSGKDVKGDELSRLLPEELIERILAMVPFPQIFKARALSKSWRARLSSVSSFDDQEKKFLALSFQKRVCESSDKWKPFWPILSFDDFLIAYDHTSQHWRRIPFLSALSDVEAMKLIPYMHRRHVSHSSTAGALLLFKCSHRHIIFVLNIFTGSWKQFPSIPDNHCPAIAERLVRYGSKDMYKVIGFSTDVGCLCAWVHDSKSRGWKRKKFEIPEDFSVVWYDVYLNGVIYVMVYFQQLFWGFVAFDVEGETFNLIQIPAISDIPHMRLLVLRHLRLVADVGEGYSRSSCCSEIHFSLVEGF